MFKLSEDRNFFNKNELGSFQKFRQYLREITYTDLSEMTKVTVCERMLDDINMSTWHLRCKFKSLLVLDETSNKLSIVKNMLEEIVHRRV